jgi:hypothetical protein
MISVRISEEEYSALRLLCTDAGARSVSELTRDAMRVLLDGAQQGPGSGGTMDRLEVEVKSLITKIEQLTAEISILRNGRSH